MPLGTTTVACKASDLSGNTATGSFAVLVRDTTAPAVSAPAALSVAATEAGGVRASASSALAAFLAGGSAVDAGDASPVRLAPQAGGHAIDSNTLFPIGTTAVLFQYRDASGNIGSAASLVSVGYRVCLLYDPNVAKKSGSTYPIKAQLCDDSGRNVSSPSIVLHAVSITQVSTSVPQVLDDSGNANPDFDFRYDAGLAGYIFNLSTKGIASGSYQLNCTAGGDPLPHAAPFAVK